MKQENEQCLDDKNQLQREMQTATDYIVQLEAKCFEANKTSLDLMNTIRNLDEENAQRIADLNLRIKTLK